MGFFFFQDYFNYIGDHVPHPPDVPPSNMYLPPLQPKYAFMSGETPRGTHEVILPKTYTTRKGALLLFSEDYANK